MELVLPLGLLAAWICLANPMTGLHVVAITGFVQDPVRKLLPGNAFYMVLGALFVFCFCAAGFMQRGGLRQIGRSRTFRGVRGPMFLFVAVVVAQAAHSVLRWESPVLAAIGLLSYVGPVAAGAVGYLLGSRPLALRSFLVTYVRCGTIAGASIIAARLLPDWKVLKPIGEGLTVYGVDLQVRLASGLLRTPEVAAWHAATAACVLLVLLSMAGPAGRSRLSVGLVGASTAILVIGVLFTGRRKAVVEIAIFLLCYAFFLARLRIGVRRLVLGVGLAAALFGYQILSDTGILSRSSRETAYLTERTGTLATDSTDRLSDAFWATVGVFERYGPLGLGAGSCAQGGQYFGADARVGQLAEAGMARIAAELGLLGLATALWGAARFVGVLRRGLGALARREAETVKLGFGLLSILMANGVVFVTASQVFGDPFVYLMLGLIGGSLFGLVDRAVLEEGKRTGDESWGGSGDVPTGRPAHTVAA